MSDSSQIAVAVAAAAFAGMAFLSWRERTSGSALVKKSYEVRVLLHAPWNCDLRRGQGRLGREAAVNTVACIR